MVNVQYKYSTNHSLSIESAFYKSRPLSRLYRVPQLFQSTISSSDIIITYTHQVYSVLSIDML